MNRVEGCFGDALVADGTAGGRRQGMKVGGMAGRQRRSRSAVGTAEGGSSCRGKRNRGGDSGGRERESLSEVSDF